MPLTEQTHTGRSAELMAVQVKLAAHYIAATLRAGDTAQRINGVLTVVTRETPVSDVLMVSKLSRRL